MSSVSTCRCCMLRPPDKNLKVPYTSLGNSEVYADMLKDCFEIHTPITIWDEYMRGEKSVYLVEPLPTTSEIIGIRAYCDRKLKVSDTEEEDGICEVCITRLRDACKFKEQVQRCQKHMQLPDIEFVKEELPPIVKEEMSDDDDNGIYFLDVKRETSDCDDDDDDDKKLAEMLGFNDITVKRRHVDHKRRVSKKRTIIAESNSIGKKSKKLTTGPLKISLRALSEMNKIIKPAKALPNMRLINERMKHKFNIDNILRYSNCTPFCNKTLSGIVCAYCKETIPNIEELRNHNRENHKGNDLIDKKRMDKNNLSVKMDITDLKCNTCLASFDIITNLKKHLSREHDVKFYADVHDYILEFKLTDSEMLNCALCNSTFETFKMLLQHMNGHYRNYICENCDLGFINKHRLKNHQRTHEIGNFKCAFCDKIFTTRVRKMCHEKYTHNSSARYTTNCPHCDQSFTSYYQRNRHMFKEHNTVAASYKCNICDKSFILKSKLTAHIKKVHLMERNHICAECGQGFFIKQSLDEHMIKHNGERVFKCTVCPKAYARKKTLREHMRIHNNDRRFKCGICALAFVQKCSLKSHMLSNHGVTLAEYENSRSNLCSPESL